ncbi:MAG: tRNA-(ms[2]io[6]A)-hydroxylase [Bacteroidota bacterium]|nr:tRNA-(ms[2]io[6]A)-hydroxylase [Bacteroidota bacterium]
MLGLKLPTDPRWVKIVEKNIHEILTDHAFCEQKAASTAISLMIRYPEESELVEAMIALAQEELSHFEMVHQKIRKRGWVLGRERKDQYVRDLRQFFPKGGSRMDQLVHQLLYAAMIEARSCERFRLLSESIDDKDLQKFYKKLMISEAHHYTLFLKLARKYGQDEKTVNKKWNLLLEFEAKLMVQLGKKKTIHG